jgi:hypothetical protein
MGYGFDINNLIVSRLPATICVGYDVEYDNDPPVRNRGTKRVIEHTFKSFKPMLYTNKIIQQEEYWPSEENEPTSKKIEKKAA